MASRRFLLLLPVFLGLISFHGVAVSAVDADEEVGIEVDSQSIDIDFLKQALETISPTGKDGDVGKEGNDGEPKAYIDGDVIKQALKQMGNLQFKDIVNMQFESKEEFMEKVKPRMLTANFAFKQKKEEKKSQRPRVTDKVYLDINIGGEPAGRIVIGVFGEIVPKTAKNFIELAKGTKDEDGNALHYKGSFFHRVMKYFMIQGGSIPGHSKGGASIYGRVFDDENFDLKHYGSGWVSMANAGKNTNSCQFFITSARHKYLDDRFVVFGKVLEGMDLVRRIEFMKTDDKDFPVPEVKFADTGVIAVDKPFPVNTIDVDPDVTTQLHDEL